MNNINYLLKLTYQAPYLAISFDQPSNIIKHLNHTLLQDKPTIVINTGFTHNDWHSNNENICVYPLIETHTHKTTKSQWIPTPLKEINNTLKEQQIDYVIATHICEETGMMLDDGYIEQLAHICHQNNTYLIIDGTQSGVLWLDMNTLGVDLLITQLPKEHHTQHAIDHCFVLAHQSIYEMMIEKDALSKAFEFTTLLEQTPVSSPQDFPENNALTYIHQLLTHIDDLGFEVLRQNQFILSCTVRTLFEEKGYQGLTTSEFESSNHLVYHNPSDTNTPIHINLSTLEDVKDIDKTIDLIENQLKHG
ncbi:MAG: aminotransferase class V-fold PLP-dependent enzyme [Alcaligenaceae bacterium]|nr:aminotransferase class V-fold PLP-dependent enzyme [Alcaligenaceae bacterium]